MYVNQFLRANHGNHTHEKFERKMKVLSFCRKRKGTLAHFRKPSSVVPCFVIQSNTLITYSLSHFIKAIMFGIYSSSRLFIVFGLFLASQWYTKRSFRNCGGAFLNYITYTTYCPGSGVRFGKIEATIIGFLETTVVPL